MKIPDAPKLKSTLQGVVRTRSSSYAIDRRQERDETTIGSPESYEEEVTTVQLYLFRPSSSPDIDIVGEMQRGSLHGYCLPDEDIRVGDRITFGVGRYEVIEPIEPQPSDADPTLHRLYFDRVTDQH